MAQGIAWMNSSRFKSSKYGGQYAGVQNSTMFSLENAWVVLAEWDATTSC
jgi:hypothetical protein